MVQHLRDATGKLAQAMLRSCLDNSETGKIAETFRKFLYYLDLKIDGDEYDIFIVPLGDLCIF